MRGGDCPYQRQARHRTRTSAHLKTTTTSSSSAERLRTHKNTTMGYLSFGPIEKYFMFVATSACARRTGAAARMEQRRRERLALLAVRGRRASRSDTRAACQAFQRMHNTRAMGPKLRYPAVRQFIKTTSAQIHIWYVHFELNHASRSK